ncbi:MAG: Class I SAM-dependent methyltransferase, partial [Deltaproteobacteria bacterium]|nr:Class I SAM-dependent methyltransferase [Deltaproteobacteria bacterium]
MKQKNRLLYFLIAAGGSIVLAAQARAQELSKLPYVPTPQIVVDEMLKMANVTAKDFVVDLGSGDGRMILTAAKTFKASGLGVDIDSKLVDLSNQAAKSQGLDERAKFIEQDMFKADISKASVITLYVLPDFMEKLRPKLLKELKPGTRIVAHDYYMSGWFPDRQAVLTVPEKVDANGTDKAYLYLWIVPSIVSGHWRMDLDLGTARPLPIVLSFNQEYQMLNAAAETVLGALKIESPTLKGEELDFFLTVGGMNYRFTGRVQGDKLEGTAVSGTAPKSIPWRAT